MILLPKIKFFLLSHKQSKAVLGQDTGTVVLAATQRADRIRTRTSQSLNRWELLKSLMKFFLGNNSMKLKRQERNKFAHVLLSRQGHVACMEAGQES